MLRWAPQEGSLNCVTAGYFARVVGTLLFRRTADIMRYLESHQAVRGVLLLVPPPPTQDPSIGFCSTFAPAALKKAQVASMTPR